MRWKRLMVALVACCSTVALASSVSAVPAREGGFGAPDRRPVWSPDGRRVAFERQGARESSVWLVRRDGAGAHRVSRYATPLWSPDGGRMAILESGMIWLASGDGNGMQLLAHGRSGAWSPDGRVFAFDKESRLHVVNRDGTGVRKLPIDVPTCSGCSSAENEPAWSPDAGKLAFVHYDKSPSSFWPVSSVWAADLDGRNLRRISEVFVAESPAWSPDGSMIAYLLYDNLSDEPYLHISASDGSRDRRYRFAYRYRYSWAPRGEVLAYEAAQPPKRLYLVRPGRGTTTIRGASAPSWAPDGQRIAFERRGAIYVGDARGQKQRRIARGVQPAWSPDGKEIAYAGAVCGAQQGIQTVSANGRSRRRVTDFCFIRGSARSELLRGTPGTDLVRAGSGDDLVLVRDSKRDVVNCGPGRDTVSADRLDRLSGCEVIRARS